MQQNNIGAISKSGTCTACGLCKQSCPKKCISLYEDELGSLYPKIDEEQCCNCFICEKVCPENMPVNLNKPIYAYVAVKSNNSNVIEKFPSSSGGIASLIYEQTLKDGGVCVGTRWNAKHEVELRCTENIIDLEYFKNSKYVYSKMEGVFEELSGLNLSSKNTAIIALPCQVAALRKKLGENDNILYVDLVCHGVINALYFQEYLDSLGLRKGQIDNITFRDTGGRFRICIQGNSEEKSELYSKDYQDDLYFDAYLSGICYREDCYQCCYAGNKRIGDMTIGDYDGKKFFHNSRLKEQGNCSLILINTEKGKQYFEKICGSLIYEKKTIEDAIENNQQLHHPVLIPSERRTFKRKYIKSRSFVKSYRGIFLKKQAKRYLVSRPIYKFLSHIKRKFLNVQKG